MSNSLYQNSILCSIKAVYGNIDKHRRLHTFELFGYDFMVDDAFKLYLIEANINPCLGVTSSFSSRFVPTLVDNTLRLAVDPMFPPPAEYAGSKKAGDILPEIRYELIFDQKIEGEKLDAVMRHASEAVCCMIFRGVCEPCVAEVEEEGSSEEDEGDKYD